MGKRKRADVYLEVRKEVYLLNETRACGSMPFRHFLLKFFFIIIIITELFQYLNLQGKVGVGGPVANGLLLSNKHD